MLNMKYILFTQWTELLLFFESTGTAEEDRVYPHIYPSINGEKFLVVSWFSKDQKGILSNRQTNTNNSPFIRKLEKIKSILHWLKTDQLQQTQLIKEIY